MTVIRDSMNLASMSTNHNMLTSEEGTRSISPSANGAKVNESGATSKSSTARTLQYSKTNVRIVIGLAAIVTILWYVDMVLDKTTKPAFRSRPNIEKIVADEVGKQMRALKIKDNNKAYLPVTQINPLKRRRIAITGGAGFIGSHLVDRLMLLGHEVTVIDNMSSGSRKNIEHWIGHPNFQLMMHDIVEPILLEVDQIYHLACSNDAQKRHKNNPIKTISTNTLGTRNMLGLAKRLQARILLASTSEIYGEPLEFPQKESYWGNVDPIGPRAFLAESKRLAETMAYAYRAQAGVSVRVARIFKTFGPRMDLAEDSFLSNIITEALQGQDIVIPGNRRTKQNCQYIDDLVDGLLALMDSDYDIPVNLGNPEEYPVQTIANLVDAIATSNSTIRFVEGSVNEPSLRPDISVANKYLSWRPKTPIKYGLEQTIRYFKDALTGSNSPELESLENGHTSISQQPLQERARYAGPLSAVILSAARTNPSETNVTAGSPVAGKLHRPGSFSSSHPTPKSAPQTQRPYTSDKEISLRVRDSFKPPSYAKAVTDRGIHTPPGSKSTKLVAPERPLAGISSPQVLSSPKIAKDY